MMSSVRRRAPGRIAGAALLAILVAACGDARPGAGEAGGAGEAEPASAEVTREYAPDLGVRLDEMQRMESGLYVQDVVEGTGALAEQGDVVVVHYTGWLPDGQEFDSSRPRGEPLDVVIGTGEVIDGWDQGVPGMRVGGMRRLVIPPALAYGVQGAGGVIPPNATLIFDVELMDVRRR
jgi:FKBP-type peptidyl-prolyl cis-trans isomerase FkpA